MSDEKLSTTEPVAERGGLYKAPAIEEIVSRKKLEREVAYAGLIGPSPTN